MDFDEVTNTIKALIVSRKGGMPLEELGSDYEEVEQCSIPYLKLGYNSLFHYIRDIKEIKYSTDNCGRPVLVVQDEKVNHLNDLIRNQKPAKLKKKSKKERKFHVNKNYDLHVKNTSRFHQNSNYSPSISSGYRSASPFSEGEEQRPTIYIDNRRNKHVYEPILNRRQLIGDDFLLQLAIRELRLPIWRKAEKTALYSGLCVSGQSIRQCIRRLENTTSIHNKVTIMLGAVDIYEGRTPEQMQMDYIELLDLIEDKFNIPRSSITICTIPPLANISFRTDYEKSSTLKVFNSWLRNTVRDYYDFDLDGVYCAYNLADFHQSFTNDIGGINYNYFQNDARYVSGTRQPWVLFNGRGRKLALALLC